MISSVCSMCCLLLACGLLLARCQGSARATNAQTHVSRGTDERRGVETRRRQRVLQLSLVPDHGSGWPTSRSALLGSYSVPLMDLLWVPSNPEEGIAESTRTVWPSQAGRGLQVALRRFVVIPRRYVVTGHRVGCCSVQMACLRLIVIYRVSHRSHRLSRVKSIKSIT
jgi:hypothetical protein